MDFVYAHTKGEQQQLFVVAGEEPYLPGDRGQVDETLHHLIRTNQC